MKDDSVSLHTYEGMVAQRDFWKEGWYQQRLATGKTHWDGYYRGILEGMRMSPHWTVEMYQLAGRIAVLLSFIRKEGPGMAKIYADRPMVPQLDPKHKISILKEIHNLLGKKSIKEE